MGSRGAAAATGSTASKPAEAEALKGDLPVETKLGMSVIITLGG
jgi:hypothetical protein